MQVCPVAAKIPATAPLTALSRFASANTMLGDLPPSSRLTRLMSFAAVEYRCAPVRSEPVNATLRTSGCSTSGCPASGPNPVTTFTTPFGNPACSTSLTNSSAEAEVYSDGFSTMVLPAARAGPSFQAVSINGEFHGMIPTQTPSGSCRVKVKAGLSACTTEPSILSASPA